MNIITLTLCPAFDVHCDAPGFSAGHENAVSILSRDAGGKGINISRALASCGVPSLACVVVGEENGEDFCRSLSADGFAYTALSVPGRIRENITLHTAGQKETRISFSGFRADASLLLRVEEAISSQLEADTILTFTGRLPQGIEMKDVQAFLARLTARGVRVVIDSRSFTLADILEAHPFLIKPNEEEIAFYYDKPIHSLDDAAEAAAVLQAKGIENVLVSMGGDGAVLASPRGRFTTPAPNVKPISTIGAGDSSIAGFLAAVRAGKSDLACLHTAVAYGSSACMRDGTLPPLPQDVERLLAGMQ